MPNFNPLLSRVYLLIHLILLASCTRVIIFALPSLWLSPLSIHSISCMFVICFLGFWSTSVLHAAALDALVAHIDAAMRREREQLPPELRADFDNMMRRE